MKVYVVSVTEVYDDPYEGNESTRIDSVWSELSKAQNHVQKLVEDNWHDLTRECGGDCVTCDPEIQEHCSLDTKDLDKYGSQRFHEMMDVYTDYLITEIELDK